jgi:uncharacterized protein YbaP (TraB family)
MQVQPNVYEGFLYEISDPATGASKGFVCGTMHTSDINGFSLHPHIIQALGKSKCLAAEALSCHASKEEEIALILRSPHFPSVQKPLEAYVNEMLEQVSRDGVDDRLLELARKRHISILELETPKMLAAATIALGKALLKAGYGSKRKRPKASYSTIITAYKTGDKRSIKRGITCLKEFKRSILFTRNIVVALKADRLLKENRMPFIAVGAAHLYDDTKRHRGLIAQLRDLGWNVSRIKDVSPCIT